MNRLSPDRVAASVAARNSRGYVASLIEVACQLSGVPSRKVWEHVSRGALVAQLRALVAAGKLVARTGFQWQQLGVHSYGQMPRTIYWATREYDAGDR